MAREISPFPEGVKLTTPIVEANVLVQSIYAESVAALLSQKRIPRDDTIPQITEGEELLTATITPTNALNRIRIRFQTWGVCSSAINNAFSAALFRDAVVDALTAVASTYESAAGAEHAEHIALEFEEVAGAVAARTYRVRIGQALAPDVGNTVQIFGTFSGSGRQFGGVARSTLIVEELTA